jgi:ariadne-1
MRVCRPKGFSSASTAMSTALRRSPDARHAIRFAAPVPVNDKAPQPAIVTILLCQHRWNADRLIDKYMDAPEQTLRAAGEPAPSARPPHSPAKPPAKRARISLAAPEPFVCEICFDAPAPDSASTLRCGHRFCNACWASYADGKIRDEGVCMVPCMADKCACVLDAPTLRRVVEPAVYER